MQTNEPMTAYQDLVFSLDIGTRTVVGMVARKQDDRHHVLDYEIVPHPDRAMYDGQIHDIDQVARVVHTVKERLEERTGLDLKHVAIAAAGRALRTHRITVDRELDYMTTITKELMDNIEMEGVQAAQAKLDDGEERITTQYYCVGYSVINYYLDDSVIQNPKGHRGSLLKADLIATFLPHSVVDSLYTVVDQVGLEVINLTLEPIAAINVAIPPKFRLLNLALVDVGAGTSDIALTKDGAIISYAMVSEAGDEITETLAQEFLLDFQSAEQLKVQLNQKDKHLFTDIVGIPYEMTTAEIVSRIEPAVEKLTQHVAQRIIEYNGRAPSAVFCIGGGCQIPGYTQRLAEALKLPPERVVIKGTESLENLEFEKAALQGPEFVTPIGIGFTALKDRHQDFLQVTVNDRQIRLFNSRELSVSDALVLIGYNARQLIAKRGEPLTVSLNGQKKTVPGEYGEPARILVGGREASLDTRLKNKDEIQVEPAIPGQPATPRVADLLPLHRAVDYHGSAVPLIYEIRVGGEPADGDSLLSDGAQVTTRELRSVADFVEYFELDLSRQELYVNGEPAKRSQLLSAGDRLEMRNPGQGSSIPETVDVAEPVPVERVDAGRRYHLVINGKTVDIASQKPELVFVDIFDHIDFDLHQAKGILELNLNGRRASYMDSLKSGDVIEIAWK